MQTAFVCAVFALTACMLFGTSAVYHRGKWSARTAGLLRRLDHSNIALITAGTYTALGVAVLPSSQAIVMLCIVWATALVIVLLRVTWLSAPRWLYTAMYVGLGWAAIFWLPELWHLAGAITVLLVVFGGVFYTAGAVVYALTTSEVVGTHLRLPRAVPRVHDCGIHLPSDCNLTRRDLTHTSW